MNLVLLNIHLKNYLFLKKHTLEDMSDLTTNNFNRLFNFNKCLLNLQY